jgi:hypothetical protein
MIMSIIYIEAQFHQFGFCMFLQPQKLDVVECQRTPLLMQDIPNAEVQM